MGDGMLARMHSIGFRPSGSAAAGDLVILTDGDADSAVTLAPQRGALVTSFRVRGRELFAMDDSTLKDASKNVRGGNPVLFPAPGKLEGDAWAWGGKRGSMKQHGFGRTLPWAIKRTSTDDQVAVTVSLASSEATRAQYPWDFEADLTFALRGTRLRITHRVQNTSDSPMPYGFGFHPYFRVEDKASARIDTKATRAFDNVAKQVIPFAGFDLTKGEVDLHLLDHGSDTSALHADGAVIEVRASPEHTRWVVWTIAGKDFVCLEPWTGAGNALNTGDGLRVLAPGAAESGWIEIALR